MFKRFKYLSPAFKTRFLRLAFIGTLLLKPGDPRMCSRVEMNGRQAFKWDFWGGDLALVGNRFHPDVSLFKPCRAPEGHLIARVRGARRPGCAVRAVRRGLSPPPGHQRCSGAQALFSEPSTGGCRRDKDEERRYLGFISSSKGKGIFRETLSQLSRARIEKKRCRAPALGC